jgi:NADPH:quinone reductase-like Zn-dependent oxidoreductase
MAGGLLKPKKQILGIDMAGRVEAAGRQVKRFRPGDAVFGGGSGTFAEYVSAREDEIQPKPDNVSFEEAAAALAAAFVALQGLHAAGQIRAGQKVLVNGASGGVGTFAVQMAKAFGAEVTGVCSTGNLAQVRSTSADHVVDYTRQDFTHGEERCDLIFDVVAKRSFRDCKQVLAPNGIYVTTAFTPALALAGLWASLAGDQKLVPHSRLPSSKTAEVAPDLRGLGCLLI